MSNDSIDERLVIGGGFASPYSMKMRAVLIVVTLMDHLVIQEGGAVTAKIMMVVTLLLVGCPAM